MSRLDRRVPDLGLPYNVLWHDARPRIIDLPQAVRVDAPDAVFYWLRDLGNLARYFECGGVALRCAARSFGPFRR